MSTPYRGASLLSEQDGLHLATGNGATPAGLVAHPALFEGFLARPDVVAAGILAVADVAGTRYADVGLAKRVANLDPVITASGDRLRLESFSVCNGVHARLDVLPEGIDTGTVGCGTTNVDINAPLRTALAGSGRAALMHLSVGSDQLRVSTPQASFTEDQVGLSERWVRGFAEVPAAAAAVRTVATLRGPAVARLLASLPRGGVLGPTVHLALRAGTLRPVLDAGQAVVSVDGAGRLATAARLARYATSLEVRADAHSGTVWVFTLPGARYTLQLSVGAYKGFSGGGSLLTLLAHPAGERAGRLLHQHLAWQPRIDPDSLADATGLDPALVQAGLAWLAASGRLGYDAAEQSWFHRELPVADLEQVLSRNPRLVGARGLVENRRVRPDGPDRWFVRGSKDVSYTVARLGESLVCNCAWAPEAAAGRGPCKHALAVVLTTTQIKAAGTASS